MARQSKTILRGGLHLAVMANVLAATRCATCSPSSRRPAEGRHGVDCRAAPRAAGKLRASDACQRHDLVDPITLLIATGLRISELLGLLWTDFDEDAAR